MLRFLLPLAGLLLVLALPGGPARAQEPDYALPCKVTTKVPKKLRKVRVTVGGERVKIQKRRRGRVTVTIKPTSGAKLVVRGKRKSGKRYKGTRRVSCS